MAEEEGEWDRGDRSRAPRVAQDHQPAPVVDPIQPDSGGQREQQVREQPDGGEQAHLRWVGVEDEHRHDRQGEQRHVVAEHGDGLAEPEPPELRFPQQRRDEPLDADHATPADSEPRAEGSVDCTV